jgi:brefeldin A-resistance guanine nucleotide exchange factor 1
MLTLRDEETIAELGKDVASALQSVLHNASNLHSVTVSRVVYYLLILLRASNEHDFLRAPVLLHAFAGFDQDSLEQCALPLTKGISECISASTALRKEMATSPDFWDLLGKLHDQPKVSAAVFSILTDLHKPPQTAITASNYESAIKLLNAFAYAAQVGAKDEERRDQIAKRDGKGAKMPKAKYKDEVARGVAAMKMIQGMTARVPLFIEQSHLERMKAWEAYWSPIFHTLTQQCLNPCREIRTQAFTVLRQSLLDPNLLSMDGDDAEAGGEKWQLEAVFEDILFGLVRQLLKPEVYNTDPVGMGETRVLASQLLTRIYLHYLQPLSRSAELKLVWGKLIELLDRLKNSGQGDTLEEAVTENVKNIVLVMNGGGYLVPPGSEGATPAQDELWAETWERLERFLPGLLAELFPAEAAKPRRTSREKRVSVEVPAAKVEVKGEESVEDDVD